MIDKIYKTFIPTISFLIPTISAFAVLEDTKELLMESRGIVTGIIIPIVFTLALLGFFWGVVKYIWSEDKEGGKKIMVWGIVALFVMSSVWGLVYFIRNELDIGYEKTELIPTVGTGSAGL